MSKEKKAAQKKKSAGAKDLSKKKKLNYADLKKIKGGGSENKQSLNSCG